MGKSEERAVLEKMSPEGYKRSNYGPPHEMRSKGSVIAGGPATAMPSRRSKSTPDLVNLSRWTELHNAPSNMGRIPTQEIWIKQTVAPRKEKAQVDMPTGPPCSAGKMQINVLGDPAKKSLVKIGRIPETGSTPVVALRYMPATTTSGCHGQFQEMNNTKDPLLDKYKNFSTVILHPKRFDFTDSMKKIND